jgi:serine/threonine-protein kinase
MDTDRNLLFGLLALQNGLINQVQLVAGFQAWTLDKARALADYLVDRGDLDADDRFAVDALVARHIKKHGGDVEKSLAAIPAGRSTRESLARIDDLDIGCTLARLASPATKHDDDRTASYSVGIATSDGQRFRVLRPHARGGLGAVFVALDTELHREVALKQILESHADDPVSRQRFVIEAEITGGLEHPGIVPVYGLGTYDDGRPFYAMRFIRGDSLKEAIDRFHGDDTLKNDHGRRSLELRKLLRRFTDVCNAVDYAHSRGVLHRDIKPGNIIVGRHGETLVVDWGLAKATGKSEPRAAERTLMPSSASGSAETLPGSAMGTPAYMSPEQACGDLKKLGPRSDVYSLGATLYCLLTGRVPFEGDDVGELLRKVQRGEFARPRHLDPAIDPALEAVCCKAMACEPGDRYVSCRALSDDIEQWMADEPVSAYAEPFSRRARRWAKRNRTAMAAGAVACLAGVVGLAAVTLVQTQAKAHIARALDRETHANAELARSKAAVQARYDLAVDAIKTFHTGVTEDFLLTQVQFKELRDRLLNSASDFYGKLGALLGKETDVDSRRALEQSNFELAELTRMVGRIEAALAAHQATLAARETLAAETGATTGIKADVGRSLTAVAFLLYSTGKVDEALAAYRRAESLLAGVAGSDPEARAALAACRTRMTQALLNADKPDQALAACKLARADQEALATVPGASNDSRRDLAATLRELGVVLWQAGKLVESVPELRAALAIQQKLADENPAVTIFRNELANTHIALATLLRLTGNVADAEAEFRAGVAICRKLADENSAVASFRRNLALCHSDLAALLADSARLSEAEAEYRTALPINQKLAEDNPGATEFRMQLAYNHRALGLLLSSAGKVSESEVEYRRALVISQKLAEENPAVGNFRTLLADSRSDLGRLLWKTGHPSTAEAELRLAVALHRKLAEENPATSEFRNGLAMSHSSLGELLSETGRAAEAYSAYRTAIALQRELAEANPAVPLFRSGLADSHNVLGWLLAQTGRPAAAEAEYRTALALYRKLADDNPSVPRFRDHAANLDNNLSVVLRRLGRSTAARDHAERAVEAREVLVREDARTTGFHAGLAENYLNRGLARRAMSDPGGAAADFRLALGLYNGLPSRSGEQWFLCACSHAALAGLAGAGVSAGEALSEADAAVAILRKAAGVGYRNFDGYRNEDALDPLRARDDFKLLMMDLAFPAEPFAATR